MVLARKRLGPKGGETTKIAGGLQRTVVYLPPEVEEELRDTAHWLECTESDLIREAVKAYLVRLRKGGPA